MAIHQADLHGSKRDQAKIDRDAMRSFLSGEGDLADGLAIDLGVIDGLRRQALALHDAGKWQRCIDVVLALVAMGSVHPADPFLLARCYRELGMTEAAEQCASHAERLMKALGIELPPALAAEETSL